MMQEQITVSIVCMTYNHGPYIEQALQGFLIQKTSFKIEVLVHDDASTDQTAAIIRQYEQQFPEIIKPIYQTENQYVKGGASRLNRLRAKGRYIALCEGDDFWIDPLKLQKQVDYMERNPVCTMCVHAAIKVFPNGRRMKNMVRPAIKSRIFTTEEVILGGGGLFATNTIMYPAKYLDWRPDFCRIAPVGDYPLAVFLSLQGEVYYIDEAMSAYRKNAPGSWSRGMAMDVDRRKLHHQRVIEMLDSLNNYTEGKFCDAIQSRKLHNQLELSLSMRDFNRVKYGDLQVVYNHLDFYGKIKIAVKQYLPFLEPFLIRIKMRIFG
jgi:glycosyltransferase involved in cell wall biosynthesis